MTDRAAIIAEIAELMTAEQRDSLPSPNFTVADMAAQLGCSDDVVLKRLRKLVRDGVLDCRMAIDEGHRRLVFWKK